MIHITKDRLLCFDKEELVALVLELRDNISSILKERDTWISANPLKTNSNLNEDKKQETAEYTNVFPRVCDIVGSHSSNNICKRHFELTIVKNEVSICHDLGQNFKYHNQIYDESNSSNLSERYGEKLNGIKNLNTSNIGSSSKVICKVPPAIPKTNNIPIGKALPPPPSISKASFMKNQVMTSSNKFINLKGGNINNPLKKKGTRSSLEWGCIREDFLRYDDIVESNSIGEYFSEFKNKVQSILNDESGIIHGEQKIEVLASSVFSVSVDIPNISEEMIDEWFIREIKTEDLWISGDVNNELKESLNNNKNNFSNTNRILPVNLDNFEDVNERNSVFDSKTSRMLQITINYFKKKYPKHEKKGLNSFKNSILLCTLDKEGMNLLLETVPDPTENPVKYETWKDCVTQVIKFHNDNPNIPLLEEEEFVYFLSLIPNLPHRLECMILKTSFDQLYSESYKWIQEKGAGLDLLLHHRKLPLLFQTIVKSRNIFNEKLDKINNNNKLKLTDKEDLDSKKSTVKYIPISSLKNLQNIKVANKKGKTLLHFIASILGELFTSEEVSILKKSSERNISSIYTVATDLIFSWLELSGSTDQSLLLNMLCKGHSDKFKEIMSSFYSEKYDQMVSLCYIFRQLLQKYIASCYYFSDIHTFLPLNNKNIKKSDITLVFVDFLDNYNQVLKDLDKENCTPPKQLDNNFGIQSPIKRKSIKNQKKMTSKSNNEDHVNLLDISKFSALKSTKPSSIRDLIPNSVIAELNLKPMFNKKKSGLDKLGSSKENDEQVFVNKEVDNTDSPIAEMCNIKNKDDSFKQDLENIDFINSVNEVTMHHNPRLPNIMPCPIKCSNKYIKNTDYNVELSNEAKLILSEDNKGDMSDNLEDNVNSKHLYLVNKEEDGNIQIEENKALNNNRLSDLLDFDSNSNSDHDDTATVALSSPSSTRLLDIMNIVPKEETLDHSPIKNQVFNRRQSILRICQLATLLDMNQTELNINNTENVGRFTLPFKSIRNQTKVVNNFDKSVNILEEVPETNSNSELENDEDYTCVLSDIPMFNKGEYSVTPLETLPSSNNYTSPKTYIQASRSRLGGAIPPNI
ncbi:formin homology 2 domain-containing protein [Cryptosporidium muris RN66]|uniref:Formin homology 2 domain-containing protein n=1 Tax=Cryptosporidium muris (strain RN66) TaxID=441375 RepID=B6AJU1_CRYMR|nr:formin homology 2 domain-containing protein [Cryptosporidium muris RN66]EEA08482.1 formin homology 2 domain-containing protein [Cryptosporidium muris RN66]|eukprot:XP_002142831.1 formin homology 2 domain-containing protein [Cryptosporidium muris RN66]